MYQPPYKLTDEMVLLCGEIRQLIGRYEGLAQPVPQPRLRRENRIKTIHGSCAIEGNSLNFDQVSAIFDNKLVSGPKKDIVEVENAIKAYQRIHEYKPLLENSLLEAHLDMMKGLIPDAGQWRKGSVGVVKGSEVIHMAPPPKRVPTLMKELFDWLRTDKKLDPLIESAIFHYEFEFIHPFSDGNGRIGRLWQHVLLVHDQSIFEYMPMESVIHDRQQEYYAALQTSTRAGSIEAFIHFSLETIRDAVKPLVQAIKPAKLRPKDRLKLFYKANGNQPFTRKDYLTHFPDIAMMTASRDLAFGHKLGWLNKRGDKKFTCYQFMTPKSGHELTIS
jgi:Fic family protein